MSFGRDIAQVTAATVRGSLLVTLPADLSPGVLEEASERTLEGLQRGGHDAVVFDLSAVRVMDRYDFGVLRKLLDTTLLLGVRPLLAGFSAGIVVHLIDSEVDTDGLETVRDLEEALMRTNAGAVNKAESLAVAAERREAVNPGKQL